MRAFRLSWWLLTFTLAVLGKQAEATPIWLTATTPFYQWSKLVDIPDGFQQGSFTLGAFAGPYTPGAGVFYQPFPAPQMYQDDASYRGGSFSNQLVSVGFSLARPGDASDPRNWETQGTSRGVDVGFVGMASGSFTWSNHMDLISNGFQAKMSSARLDPYPRPDFDLNRDAPPFLLDLMKHPERVSMGEFLSYRYGNSPLTVTIAPPPPIPEPTPVTLFGILLASGIILRWRRR
jgi:hypothetical protein